jgi:hypothetical protein
METSLHRELKDRYANGESAQEVQLDGFRIDVVHPDQLIEIQHGPLAAIRDKVARLLKHHRLLVVKPLPIRKRIVRLPRRGGAATSQRWSPKRGTALDLFHELVYFTRVFPHPNLTLEVPLVEVEERRFPGHGRRRWRRDGDHQVEDVRLLQIRHVYRFASGQDLLQLIPCSLPDTFDTGVLAVQLHVPRWVAQRIAYCLRAAGSFTEVGKRGNAKLYRRATA